MKRNIWTMVAFASFAVAGVATALWTAPAAATELVDNDKVQCPTAEHTTIQAGVDAASPGELVLVCDGVYREAVRIFGPGKDGVRLRAKVVHGATIKAPAGYSGTGSGGTSPGPNNTGAIVLVQEDEVEVSGFRIVGPFTGLSGSGCPEHPNEDGFGVLVTNGAVGVKVLNNFIHQIADQSAGLCDFDGFGVGVSGEARVVIGNNRIQDYRNFGVLASGENTFVLVHHNEIIGGAVNQDALFPRSVAQVGVSVSGAQADVNANVITKNLGPTDVVNESAGVIVGGGAVNVRVSHNRVFENDFGIEVANVPGGGVQVRRNVVFDNNNEGLVAGSDTANILFKRNDVRGNAKITGTDCRDDSSGGSAGFPFFGTGNQWKFNKGFTVHPPEKTGICTPQ